MEELYKFLEGMYSTNINGLVGYELLHIFLTAILTISTFAMASYIAFQVINQRKQLDFHKELESFKILREFRTELKRDAFKDVVNKLSKKIRDKSTVKIFTTEDDKQVIRSLLTEFEIIAIQWHKKIMDIDDIDKTIGAILYNIKIDTDETMKILEDRREKNPKIYSTLFELLNEIEKRHKDDLT